MTAEITRAMGFYAWTVEVYVKDANGVDVGNAIYANEGIVHDDSPYPLLMFTMSNSNLDEAEQASRYSVITRGLDITVVPGESDSGRDPIGNAIVEAALTSGMASADWTDLIANYAAVIGVPDSLAAPYSTSGVKIIEGTTGYRDITPAS